MVKGTKKPLTNQNNTINSVSINNKTQAKSRQQIYSENYQKNKERKRQQRQQRYQHNKETEKSKQKQRYLKKKEKKQLISKQLSAQYYGAEAIKILMTFKEYTELNKEKQKLWQDFNWTLKDCQKQIKEGLGNIVSVMKLAQVADNLIRDYWDTAKNEIKKGKNWDSLDYDQQQKLIKYWAYEKARKENNYLAIAEQLEQQSKEYLKEIELAKFHEERGKVKCSCYSCENKKEIHQELEKQRQKIITDYEKGQEQEKIQWLEANCPNCGEYKKVNSENGLCKKCDKEQNPYE